MTDPSKSLLDQTDEQLPFDENKDYLNELVGEDKRYKNINELAKSKAYADLHIKTVENRFDELTEEYKRLREENIAGQKLQELIDKNETLIKQLASKEHTQNPNEGTAAYDPKQVESLVSSTVLKMEQGKKEQENYQQVMDKLTDNLGESYKTVLKKQANDLGLSDEEVNSMARRNPKLFYKTFGLDSSHKENFQTPPRSERRSDSFAPRSSERRTWSYYQDLRKKDPMAWLDKKIAVQMEKDAQALGKDFYDV